MKVRTFLLSRRAGGWGKGLTLVGREEDADVGGGTLGRWMLELVQWEEVEPKDHWRATRMDDAGLADLSL